MTPRDEQRPPPLRLLFGELSVVGQWARARLRPVAGIDPVAGHGAPVITLPGFLASDLSMAQLRANLRAGGFAAHGWQLGINRGARADTLERLHRRVSVIADRHGAAPALVGWSLGGVFAREYAKHHPDQVARVVTLGSPFSGSRRANHAWRLYRIVAGHDVDHPPINLHPADKPPVPTFALWSPRDGVVAPASARGEAHERDVAIELDCGHMSFAFAPDAARAIIGCLTLDVAEPAARSAPSAPSALP